MRCPNYFGHIELARPVFYINYLAEYHPEDPQAMPLTNEPGFFVSHKYVLPYNQILEYKNIEIAIIAVIRMCGELQRESEKVNEEP